VPSEKRLRQRAAREARLAAEAKAKKRRRQFRNGAIVVVVAGVVIGIVALTSGNSTPKKNAATATTTTVPGETPADAKVQKAADTLAVKAGCPASVKAAVNTQLYSSAPAMTIDPNKLYSASIVTTAGTIDMSLYAKSAPKTVNNFVFLADKGYFHCNAFFRVETNFVDQTGDPSNTGSGGAQHQPGYKFADENLPKAYAAGDVAMANSGANTNGSQFFLVATGGQAGLGPNYSLFGHVVSGMSVVDKINHEGNTAASNGVPPLVTERILSVTIHQSSGA
jgi:cyclophilin family peptidyl-prolyl cis-trans isomerase